MTETVHRDEYMSKDLTIEKRKLRDDEFVVTVIYLLQVRLINENRNDVW